jgi:dUTP pyrophosphatase
MNIEKKLKFKKLHENAKLPSFGTEHSAGFDFFCIEDLTIKPKETLIVKTGLSVEIPNGYFMSIVPRSSTGIKTPLRLANSVGIIDSDYRGELGLIFTNTNEIDFIVKKGDRLAQGYISEKIQMEIEEVKDLSETQRGDGGFGSTGK